MTRSTAPINAHRGDPDAPNPTPSIRTRAHVTARGGFAGLVTTIAAALLFAGCSLASGTIDSLHSGRRTPARGVELPAGPRARHPGVSEPDPSLTPGAVLPAARVAQICRRGYARAERAVSIALKREVFRAYRVRYVPGRYEVDHLVPLELGGANAGRNPRTSQVVVTANLWPEPRPSAAVKDRLENRLHDKVCAGHESLRAAQRAIARDWYAAWVGEGRP